MNGMVRAARLRDIRSGVVADGLKANVGIRRRGLPHRVPVLKAANQMQAVAGFGHR